MSMVFKLIMTKIRKTVEQRLWRTQLRHWVWNPYADRVRISPWSAFFLKNILGSGEFFLKGN